MFFQPSAHTVKHMDFLTHQKLSEQSEHMLLAATSSPNLAMSPPTEICSAKRARMDSDNYERSVAASFVLSGSDSTVTSLQSTMSRVDYESMKQELGGIRRSLGDFRSSACAELETLRSESSSLKSRIMQCSCCHKPSGHSGWTAIKKRSPSADNGTSSALCGTDRSMDDVHAASGLVAELLKENKRLQQRNEELEKQLRQLRSGNRVPPLPSSEALTFMRDLMTYYTTPESLPSMPSPVDTKTCHVSATAENNIDSSLTLPNNYDAMNYDAQLLGNSQPPNLCSLYDTMPEMFDVERGLQVQLLPNYSVWVNKSKLQFIVKEAASAQRDGAPLFVLRRLIPLVFTWDEMAASRGQGLNCRNADDILIKDPLDPTKVLVCKAYMRKFCMEMGHLEPTERQINETFSHQVNYARRKFKQRVKPVDVDGMNGCVSDNSSPHAMSNDSYNQSHHEALDDTLHLQDSS